MDTFTKKIGTDEFRFVMREVLKKARKAYKKYQRAAQRANWNMGNCFNFIKHYKFDDFIRQLFSG